MAAVDDEVGDRRLDPAGSVGGDGESPGRLLVAEADDDLSRLGDRARCSGLAADSRTMTPASASLGGGGIPGGGTAPRGSARWHRASGRR